MKNTPDIYMASYIEDELGIKRADVERIDYRRLRFHYDITDAEWLKINKDFDDSVTGKVKSKHSDIRDTVKRLNKLHGDSNG